MLEQMPEELRLISKWCIAAPDKSPWTTSGRHASVTDPATWTDWYSARLIAEQWGAHIGFVLGEEDEYTCIDLDVKDTTTQDQLDRFHRIIQAFDSYTEHSLSGRGYHIWIKGKVGTGCRRDGVEVYSQQRFIICTGNVVNPKTVEPRQELLDLLVSEMRQAAQTSVTTLVETGEVESDDAIWNKAVVAGNADKFLQLWGGTWQAMGYPSQSEADLALLSMLCFYTRSNEQVRRLFRYSELGKREKATKNNRYIDRTLVMIRARQEREDQQTDIARAVASRFANAVTMPSEQETPTATAQKKIHDVDWPPGLIGEVAQWVYSISPRPVKEVAIVASLGFFSGLCGKSYNISGSGLNTYLVLVARSAIGKEALHTGISKLVSIMSSTCPNLNQAVDFADYASGPALIKAAISRSSFVNVSGEWGRKLRRMAADRVDGPMESLRTSMTHLYQKSGMGNSVGGIGYSDRDKNMLSTGAVAYSMIGETTPDTFYESLTNSMMSDGFLSRFITVEYTGGRPNLNPVQEAMVTENIGNTITNLYSKVEATPPDFCNDVAMSREAQEMLDAFDKLCDLQINSSDDESQRQMWNRAHLKALKVSALLAVADNAYSPCIQVHHAEWALSLITRDIQILDQKLQRGDIGDGDNTRDRKMLSTISDYLKTPLPKGYKIPEEVRNAGIIPRKYLQVRLHRNSAFTTHKLGASMALDLTIKNLIDNGYLVEISKDKMIQDGRSVSLGKCYQVVSDPTIAEGKPNNEL